jgi:hypothetical protein
MNNRAIRRNSCTSKKAMGRNEARQSAICIRKHGGERMHAYYCEFCKYWHIGHRNKHRKRMVPHEQEQRNERRAARVAEKEAPYCINP